MPKGQAGAPWDGCHHREDAFQRVIYSPEILRGCLLDHAGECKLLKSRMPWVQVGAGSRFISLGCWELVKCHNYHLFSSHPWVLHGSDLWNSDYLCHGNNMCWHSHPSPLFNSPVSQWVLQKQREWEGKPSVLSKPRGLSGFSSWMRKNESFCMPPCCWGT